MKLSHLRCIVEVAKTGSITRAAQNLYMGQPNLSKAIKDMESDLGFTVFKRGTKGAIPTQKGIELIERAKELLEKADSFEEDYFGSKEKNESISAAVCGAEWCIPIFERAAAEFNGLAAFRLEYFRCDTERVSELAKSGEISFAAVRDYDGELEKRLLGNGLKGRRLCTEKAQIVTARINRAAQKEIIEAVDTENFTEVYICGTKSSTRKKAVAVSDLSSAFKVLTGLRDSFMTVSERDPLPTSGELCIKPQAIPDTITDWLVFGESGRLSASETEAMRRLAEGI